MVCTRDIDEVNVNAWWSNFVRLFASLLIPQKNLLVSRHYERNIPINLVLPAKVLPRLNRNRRLTSFQPRAPQKQWLILH